MYCCHAKPIFMPVLLLLVLSVIFTPESGYASAKTGITAINNKPPLTAGQTYLVKKGDTLYAIGLNSGHGYQNLASWNRITPPYLIITGQTLNLFPPAIKKQPPDKHHNIVVTKNHDNAHQPPFTLNAKEKKSIISIDNKKMLKLSFKWPVNGKLLKNFSQSGKQGIDIQNKISKQAVLAAESGQVVYIGQGLSNFRNLIIIKHGHGYLSAYANTKRLLAKEGQQVEKGQVIAEIGATGNQQNTLHFEIRKNGNPVDPINLLPK